MPTDGMRRDVVVLTNAQIEAALPHVKEGVQKYLQLQDRRDACDVRTDLSYRRAFNHFYRVRRGRSWQDKFYDLLETTKGQAIPFAEVLDSLHRSTGRYEALFSSKLLATVDPELPVIDSIVLRNLNLRLPAVGSKHRAERIAELHDALVARFRHFLATPTGRHLVRRFRETYPDAHVTEIKMLDLVLWQTRGVASG